jgi:hypothetical protein
MTIDALLACLRSIRPPEGVEEWLIADKLELPGGMEAAYGDYGRGIRDVLIGLGVLTASGDPVSPTAYYFIQSLLASVRDSTLNAGAWQGLAGDACSGFGARLVHSLEEHRLLCGAPPTPLRKVQTVIAIIKGQRAGEDVYLMQYDGKAEQFQPIGGKQELYDADSTAALTRELCEELAISTLTPGTDFKIQPIKEHSQLNEVSASIHVVTQYDHSFYHLTDIRFPVVTDQLTRWLSWAEMEACRTSDGLAITSLLHNYLPGVLPTLGYSLVTPAD